MLVALIGLAAVVIAALIYTHHSSTSDNSAHTASGSGTSGPKSEHDADIYFKFDARGGGSTTIDVYPSSRSKNDDGTYFSGQRIAAVCKKPGREVSADVTSGERPGESSWWIRLKGPQNQLPRYASLTYGHLETDTETSVDISRLDSCPS